MNLEGINPYYSHWQRLACLVTANRLEDTKYLQFAVVARPNKNGGMLSNVKRLEC